MPPLRRPILPERELQVLRLIVQGESLNEIARQLFISDKTASTHKGHILSKLGLKSVAKEGAPLRIGHHAGIAKVQAGREATAVVERMPAKKLERRHVFVSQADEKNQHKLRLLAEAKKELANASVTDAPVQWPRYWMVLDLTWGRK